MIFVDEVNPAFTYEALLDAKAELERRGYRPIINLATQIPIPIPNLLIPDWLIHDYIIKGEVTNVKIL